MSDSEQHLPSGWVQVKIGDIFAQLRSKVSADSTSPLPFIGMDHVESETMRLTGMGCFAKMKSAGTHFHPGDILYGRLRPYLNKIFHADIEGISSAEFLVFPQVKTVTNGFFKYVLTSRSFVSFASNPLNVTGDRPRIDFNTIAKYRFYLPPWNEQSRIVSKIEELFSDLDKAEEALRKAQTLLKQYRQSVLKAAVTGELTRDWREQNKDRLETGEALLKRILKARREAWEKAELKKMRAKGVKPKDDSWKKKYVEPKGPDTTGLPELPEGWVWATFYQLGEFGRGKSKHRPRNDPKLFGDNYPFLQTGTVRASNGRIKTFDSHYSKFGLAQSKLWPAGTICITIAANIAASGILDFEACFPDSVVGLIPAKEIVGEYIEFFVRTARNKLDIYAPATAQKNINLEILESVAIPIPPTEEQKQIFSKAWEIMSSMDAVEADLDKHFESSSHLRQSILKSAFSGTLVPQNPNDEPASELLKRIAAEKSKQSATLPARRGGPRKKRTSSAPAHQTSAPKASSEKRQSPGLAHLRKSAGMSQTALAKAVGLNQASISQMETGKRAITAEQARELARVLGVTIESLQSQLHE